MRYPEYSSVQVVGHSSLAGNMKSLDLEVQQTAQGALCSYTFGSGDPPSNSYSTPWSGLVPCTPGW